MKFNIIKVLIIEDVQLDYELVKRHLSKQINSTTHQINKYQITNIKTLKEAISFLHQNHIDVIISDLGLPDSQGLSTIKELRRNFHHLPIIILTEVDSEYLLNKETYIDVQDYLVKSEVSPGIIRRSIQYAIETKRYQNGIRKLEEELSHTKKQDSLNIMSEGIAHEFNNKLAIISVTAELLKKKKDIYQKAAHEIDLLLKTVGRCASLTKKILLYGKKMPIEKSPTNLQEIINTSIPKYKELIGDGISFNINIDDGDYSFLGNYTLIDQSIQSLLINAKESMGDTGKCTLSLSKIPFDKKLNPELEDDFYFSIKVKDSGQGISSVNMDKVYDPFFTTKNLATSSGLGLSATKGILEQHQGKIIMSSKEGVGTEVELIIPANS